MSLPLEHAATVPPGGARPGRRATWQLAAHADAFTFVALVIAVAALGLAWRMRFVQDDAFIAFQYARSLVQGHGLTWFGTRVEGYTDFLWVLWIGAGMRCGASPIAWSYAGGLLAFAAVLHATWRLATAVCGRSLAAVAALLLAATNASVLWFATGGLETMLQAAWISQATLQLVRLRAAIDRQRTGSEPDARAAVRHAAWLGTWLAAAVLTRLDSALPALVLATSAVLAMRPAMPRAARADRQTFPAAVTRDATSRPQLRRLLLALALPAVFLLGPWLGWKLVYYGSLLPNTYAAKVAWSGGGLAAGFLYVWRFLAAYLWWPFLAILLVDGLVRLLPGGAERPAELATHDGSPAIAGQRDDRRLPATVVHATQWTILALVASWLAYLVAIGGDFMEFRLFVPVLPLACVGLAARLGAALPRRLAAPMLAVVVLVLGGASLQHARRFRTVTPDRRLDSVPALATFYDLYPDRDFATLGTRLGQHLAGTDALLALHAVGAIPYYSNLRTLDMFGLNDVQVAHAGLHAPPHFRRPGHQRQVSLASLRRRGVNLVIGHPTLVPHGTLTDPRVAVYGQWVRDVTSYSREPIGTVRLVGMSTPRGDLLMWYLTPTPAIDAALLDHGWESATIEVAR